MSWILEGQKVTGKYFGIPFTGTVEESRVKYGGRVSHTINLDSPIQMPWRTELTTRIISNDEELENVNV